VNEEHVMKAGENREVKKNWMGVIQTETSHMLSLWKLME